MKIQYRKTKNPNETKQQNLQTIQETKEIGNEEIKEKTTATTSLQKKKKTKKNNSKVNWERKCQLSLAVNCGWLAQLPNEWEESRGNGSWGEREETQCKINIPEGIKIPKKQSAMKQENKKPNKLQIKANCVGNLW